MLMHHEAKCARQKLQPKPRQQMIPAGSHPPWPGMNSMLCRLRWSKPTSGTPRMMLNMPPADDGAPETERCGLRGCRHGCMFLLTSLQQGEQNCRAQSCTAPMLTSHTTHPHRSRLTYLTRRTSRRRWHPGRRATGGA